MPSFAQRFPLLFPVGLLLISMLSIQAGAALAKSLFPLVGAAGTTALRLVFATLLLGLALRPWRRRLSAEAWRRVALFGVCLGSMNLLFYQAIQTVPLGIAVALEFTGPLCVAILASRRLLDFAWIALAILGLALLLPHEGADRLDPWGATMALAAGVCWGLYIVLGQRAGSQAGSAGIGYAMAIAAVTALPFGLFDGGAALFDLGLIPLALGVALLSSALPYSLEMIALTRLPARTFGTLMSLEPVSGALSGLVFLGERLTLLQLLAIAAIILASAGATLTSRPKGPPPAELG